MTHRFLAVATAAVLLAAPGTLAAQAPGSPFKFGLALGATFPTGDASDFYDWGYHIAGNVSAKPALSPVGLRGEVMYHRLTGATASSQFGSVDVPDANVIAGIVNAELGLGKGTGAKPYLIGGLGVYHISASGADGTTKFGFNIGAGLNLALAGFDAFAEARFHSVQTEGSSTNLVPLSFGIRF